MDVVDLEQVRSTRALALVAEARLARDELRLADQVALARRARSLASAAASQVAPHAYSAAVELEVDGLMSQDRCREAYAVASADHRLDSRFLRVVLRRIALQAQLRVGNARRALIQLVELDNQLEGHGRIVDLERLAILERTIHGAIQTGSTSALDRCRPKARRLADELEAFAPDRVAHARHWLGVSESLFPTLSLSAGTSADTAVAELAWSLAHRVPTARSARLRPFGEGELLLVGGDRDGATARFTDAVAGVREVLPRHHHVAASRLRARGLLAA